MVFNTFSPAIKWIRERFVDTFKRAILKLEGKETTQEIVEIFLGSYRTTSNPNTFHGNSLAEVLINHKVRLYLDVIHTTRNYSLEGNTLMEEQFNHYLDLLYKIVTKGPK